MTSLSGQLSRQRSTTHKRLVHMRRKYAVNRLWVQLSLTFVAVLLLTTIGTGLLAFFFLRPNMLPEQTTATTLDRQQLQELRNRSLLLTLFAGGVSAVAAGVWMSRRLTKPLNQLVEGTQAITARDLAHRVPIRGSQELQALAGSFNKMAAALESAERLRRNLLSDVAHELRTPLTVLQGNLRAILDDVYTLDKSEVARLYDQTRHLISLVNDLHELAQAEAHQLPLNLAPVDVGELVNAAGELLEAITEEADVCLVVDVPDVPVTVQADKARLMQVIQNLLSNALRHTPTQGVIQLRVARTDDQVIIAVEDNGDGIDAEHLPFVFDRFYRTDRARTRDQGGAGLGLAIVRAMVEAQGGHTHVSSPGVGKGSTFTVTLPALETTAPDMERGL